MRAGSFLNSLYVALRQSQANQRRPIAAGGRGLSVFGTIFVAHRTSRQLRTSRTRAAYGRIDSYKLFSINGLRFTISIRPGNEACGKLLATGDDPYLQVEC